MFGKNKDLDGIPYGTCAYWYAMDAKFETPTASPLHHDNRCREHFSVRWENGVSEFGPIGVATKAAAFATLDRVMRNAEYPSSIHIQILENGTVVWSQHGTFVEVNR